MKFWDVKIVVDKYKCCENAGIGYWMKYMENSESDTNVASQEESALNMEHIFGSESAESNSGVRNILIVYFSRWGNTDYPDNADATASASIVADEAIRYGTTEYITNMIAKKVGGDLHQIETATPYTTDFDELRDVNHDEMDQNYLPGLKESNLDISGYDTVFVGYPVWATGVPQSRRQLPEPAAATRQSQRQAMQPSVWMVWRLKQRTCLTRRIL